VLKLRDQRQNSLHKAFDLNGEARYPRHRASSNDSLTYPLNDSAVQLALDNHGIDDSADVVDGRVVDELHDAGIEVDFYFGDVAASGMPSQ
jgi:hypothetical protein